MTREEKSARAECANFLAISAVAKYRISTLMPKFNVIKSIFMEAPVRQVYDSVRDFRQWPAWSPWLIAEPESRMDYSADGKSYSWNGKITGSGEMTITGEDAPRSIDYQLTFLKPWKSVNSVRFIFADRDGGTEVT